MPIADLRLSIANLPYGYQSIDNRQSPIINGTARYREVVLTSRHVNELLIRHMGVED
jgi:hypothetical protein